MLYEFFRQRILEVVHKIPNVIETEEFVEKLPLHRDRPFNTLLFKETARYNILLTKIKDNLTATLGAMEGLR